MHTISYMKRIRRYLSAASDVLMLWLAYRLTLRMSPVVAWKEDPHGIWWLYMVLGMHGMVRQQENLRWHMLGAHVDLAGFSNAVDIDSYLYNLAMENGCGAFIN